MAHSPADPDGPKLPQTPIDPWLAPLRRLAHQDATGGILLVLGTAVALALANSPWHDPVHHFWHDTHLGLNVGSWSFSLSLEHLINDGLMTLFFFVVGLEIKREIVAGELASVRKATLPILGALGGMLVPAAIYFTLQKDRPGEPGWGIPMATDIAFVVGVLALLGPRIPSGLKIFLLTLAIVDDIGAILVIALVYSSSIHLLPLALGAVGFAGIFLLQRLGVRNSFIYFAIGVAVWFAFFDSGIHPTIAGVVLGLLTPSAPWIDRHSFALLFKHARPESASTLSLAAHEATAPLDRLLTALHPWVLLVIMPIFALANAGVPIEASLATHEVAVAVALGLALGKPLGIFVFCWLGVRLGWASLPRGVDYRVLVAAGCLAGIGFTMSLFIDGLALKDPVLQDAGKLGTLLGSLVSAVWGCVLLLRFLPRKE